MCCSWQAARVFLGVVVVRKGRAVFFVRPVTLPLEFMALMITGSLDSPVRACALYVCSNVVDGFVSLSSKNGCNSLGVHSLFRSYVRLCEDNARQVIRMDEIGSNFKDAGSKANAQSRFDAGFDKLNGCAEEQMQLKAEDEKVEEILSEEVKQQRREEALVLKEQGNTEFKTGNYGVAIGTYGKALEVCPQCFKKDIAILFSNRAACYVKSGENKAAIQDCTSALEHDAYYVKARLRRAQTYEACEKLDEALEDYKEVLKFDRSCQAAGEAVLRLPEQINQRNEKLKTEMMGKLKDLGNMCLRPFGLSTDNFKMQQDPNTGGYSISFQR